jgi:hypothetical protein
MWLCSLAILAEPPTAAPRRPYRPHRVVASGGLVVAACWPDRRELAVMSSGRAGSPGKHSCQVEPITGGADFQGGWAFGNDGDLRLLLDDNYIRTITNQTTEAQRHRDFLAESKAVSSLPILAGHRQPRPVGPSTRIGTAHRSSLLAGQTIELPKA